MAPGGQGIMGSTNCAVLLFGLIFLITLQTFTQPVSGQHKQTKDIPSLKLAKFAGPTLTFMFCTSWGYRRVFEQFAQAIQQKYPDLIIQGDNYPPTTVKAYLAQALGILKIVVILMIVSGQNPFTFFNVETPDLYTWAQNNKIYACLILFLYRMPFRLSSSQRVHLKWLLTMFRCGLSWRLVGFHLHRRYSRS